MLSESSVEDPTSVSSMDSDSEEMDPEEKYLLAKVQATLADSYADLDDVLMSGSVVNSIHHPYVGSKVHHRVKKAALRQLDEIQIKDVSGKATASSPEKKTIPKPAPTAAEGSAPVKVSSVHRNAVWTSIIRTCQRIILCVQDNPLTSFS